MKKVLSLSLILALGIAGFAQTRDMVPQKAQMRTKVAVGNEKATGVNQLQNVEKTGNALPSKAWHYETLDEYEVMINSYDLQSNSLIANHIASFGDGTLATVATFMPGDKSPYNQASAYRGTGYNYFDGSDFGEQPSSRFENQYTGWPSIAPYGPNGEIVVCHTGNGLVYYTRENKGEGNWVGPKEIPNPEGDPSIAPAGTGFSLSWPRVATSGPDHTIINIVALDQWTNGLSGDAAQGEINTFLARSTDGENWTVTTMPEIPNGGVNQFSADDYCAAYNGNTVAFLFLGNHTYSTDILLVKSTDNGETWSSTVVWENPFHGQDWNDPFIFDTINHDLFYTPYMASLAIDKNGKAHVAMSSGAIRCGDGDGTYSYYMGFTSDGVYYWKEGDETIKTGPVFEDGFSDDYLGLAPYATHIIEQDTFVAYNDHYIAGTVLFQYGEDEDNPDYYFDRVNYWKFDDEAGGLPEDAPLYYVSNFPTTKDYTETLYRGTGSYQTVNGNYANKIGAGAMCGWPAITVDDNGIVAIAYSVPDWRREGDGSTGYAYRAVYISYIDNGVVYPNADYLAEDFSHMVDEMTNIHALPNSFGNRQFVFGYMCDPGIGWAGTSASNPDDPPAHSPAENTFFVSVVTPDVIIDNVKEAVNPMNSVSVRPNPATDALYIDINAKQSSNMTAVVYNITGQKVMEQNMSLTTGANTRSINVSNLTSGIYFVTVKANNFENTMKFIVK